MMIPTIHTLLIGENGGAFGDEELSTTSFTSTSFGDGEGVGEEEICTGENSFSMSSHSSRLL